MTGKLRRILIPPFGGVLYGIAYYVIPNTQLSHAIFIGFLCANISALALYKREK